jgi:hypothetical protein
MLACLEIRAHKARMKHKSRSKETVKLNLFSRGKLWTTVEVPKDFMDYLADYAKKTRIPFDEAFNRVLGQYIERESARRCA